MYWKYVITAFIILEADYLVKCAYTIDFKKITVNITTRKIHYHVHTDRQKTLIYIPGT